MSDTGLEAVDALYEQLMVDDGWAVRHERGFSWWSYRLAQHIEAGPALQSGDLDVYIVRIWTDEAHDVGPEGNPAAMLGHLNQMAQMSTLVWDENSGIIFECCTAVVHRENIGWLSKVLATAAVLQNTAAHSRAHGIAKTCGGVPSASAHPTSGQRSEMDDILNVPEQVIAAMGAEPSRYTGVLSEGLGATAASMGWVANSDATGVVYEIPFTGNRPLFLQDAGSPDTVLETALVQIFTDQPHPEAGNGALLVMRLPVSPDPGDAVFLANGLNLAESSGDWRAPLLGAWCPDPMSDDGRGLAFSCFLPNLLARPGLLENQVVYQGGRVRFALEELARLRGLSIDQIADEQTQQSARVQEMRSRKSTSDE